MAGVSAEKAYGSQLSKYALGFSSLKLIISVKLTVFIDTKLLLKQSGFEE